ncbi:MAG: hypothetical protein J6B89_03480 [Bacilli bacterium]|nr:hypothetical protein [Bacilli bacterium]
MLINLWNKILALFGKKQSSDDSIMQTNEHFVAKYENNTDINFISIFANKLANYTINDSNIDVTGDNKRAELLQKVIKKLKRKLKKVVARNLGVGGVLVIPYSSNSKIYFNIISQSRLLINKMIGDDIVDCTVLAEHIVRNKEHYFRWTDYTLIDGNLYIKYRATLETSPIDIKTIEEWSNIQDIAITNVKKMPFMFLSSPIDNRKEKDDYGVPITYGCEKQIKRIMKDLEQIDREYGLKEAFVGADITMFKGDDALPLNGLYKKINSGEDSFWEVFDPAFRDTSLYNKLMQDFALLEKQIGTNRGILTDPLSTYQNKDEARRANQDTFSIVDDIRDSLEEGLADFLYACDVLANYYNLTPPGEYKLSTDWSYSMLEDSQQEFNQLLQGESKGAIKKSEIRQYLKPNETLEEAQAVIDEIKKENPSTKDLLGE